jgi:2-dehydro-3-deoxyphosphogluconate aldolase/(4S)-4-hydroxy-2-oxoglutarate aldolase
MTLPLPAHAVAAQLAQDRVIAVVRIDEERVLRDVAQCLVDGGIQFVEITLTSPGALSALRTMARDRPAGIRVGVGSVTTVEQARAAILEGADYLVCPVFHPEIVRSALRYDRMVIPGAFTPTEVHAAWRTGAHAVKVFPADVGGPAGIRAMLAPMPELKLVPTGGVNLDTIGAFFEAGSFAVAVGSALVQRRLVAERAWDALRETARQYANAAAHA